MQAQYSAASTDRPVTADKEDVEEDIPEDAAEEGDRTSPTTNGRAP
jgi:hypothetical protein